MKRVRPPRDELPPVSLPPLPPRYERVAALGKGGGGEVWSVRDRVTGQLVAMKVLAEDAHLNEIQALVREASALSGVEGIGVPRVLRFGSLPRADAEGDRQASARAPRLFMVRELVEGRSLTELLAANANGPELLAALASASDLLTRMHRALVLHGDLKPANIIVGKDGRSTLVDLGLAATWREGGARPSGLTPRYAAPELIAGGELTPRAEVFALGATLDELIRSPSVSFDPAQRAGLQAVVARATALDPSDRHPSADEFGSALRRAAGIEEPGPSLRGSAVRAVVWPMVGLERAAAALVAQIAGLRAGGGLVVTGPDGSGRSTLLRRLAWGLGVTGKVAWIEATESAEARAQLLEIELGVFERERRTSAVVLVDDAEELTPAEMARLSAVRERGAKLVLVFGTSDSGASIDGPTLEVFAMPKLAPEEAGELVKRAIPSLSEAVTAHVLALASGWPGRLREIVERMAGAPVVTPEDVDRLLEDEATPSKTRADIESLLDKGHYEEAAELLARFREDASPEMAIARARLATNQGDARAAVDELERARDRLPADDPALFASFRLAWARAHLRAGLLAEAERAATDAIARLGLDLSGNDPLAQFEALTRPLQRMTGEMVAVAGLAQSLAARHADARATLDRAVSLARALGEPRLLSVALVSLGFALQRDDHLTPAKAAYEAGLNAAEEAGDAGSVATTRLNLAGIAKTQGDLAAALQHLEAAVDMGRRSGRVAVIRQALLNLANLDLYLGRTSRARGSLDALAKERGELAPNHAAQLFALEAEYAHRTGDGAAADRLCLAAAEAYEGMGRSVDAAEARLERVIYAASRADEPATREAVQRDGARQIELASSLLGGASAHGALLAFAKGRLATVAGDDLAAREALDRALETARTSGQRDWVWRALEARADVEAEAGQSVKARHDREAALVVLEEIAGALPRDLREVFWNDPRRAALRAASARDLLVSAATAHAVAMGSPSLSGAPPTAPGAASFAQGDRSAGLDRLARILEINRAIAGELDLDRLLDKVTDHAIALLGAEHGFVILRSGYARSSSGVKRAGGDGDLSVHASRDQQGEEPHARFSQSIAEQVLSTGLPVVTANARGDLRMSSYLSVHQLMLESVACVPIRARTGGTIGALYLETRLLPAQSFAAELGTLTALADQVAIAIETARLAGENARHAAELEHANAELTVARAKLEELLGHRTAQLQATRRDLRSARAILRGHFGYDGLVGTSEAMRRVYALIDRVKDNDVPVLITGESGTGKEVVARAIHNAGPRGKRTFVGINCGAIPEHLLESELFGHVRGAFTGAERDRKGLFQEATDGTLLLDEIGEMPQKMQAGLLRVLQEKVARPVGGTREEPIDTRVIAATHRDLAAMAADGIFREDLYYRLHVIELHIPALRDRIEDIPALIDHFLGIFAARHGRDRRSVSRAALKRLASFSWPGNVRQLENVLLNAWILSDRPELEADDFELPTGRVPRPPAHQAQADGAGATNAPSGSIAPAAPAVESSLDAHRAGERERILLALARSSWNRVKAAEMVGLPRRTFYRRLKEYGIQ